MQKIFIIVLITCALARARPTFDKVAELLVDLVDPNPYGYAHGAPPPHHGHGHNYEHGHGHNYEHGHGHNYQYQYGGGEAGSYYPQGPGYAPQNPHGHPGSYYPQPNRPQVAVGYAPSAGPHPYGQGGYAGTGGGYAGTSGGYDNYGSGYQSPPYASGNGGGYGYQQQPPTYPSHGYKTRGY